MNCEPCKKILKNKTTYNLHLKTDTHKRMSNPRFCIECKEPISSDELYTRIRCIDCHLLHKTNKATNESFIILD